jgi:hypothetical protein
MILNADGKWPVLETKQEPQPVDDLGAFIDELLENREALIARIEYDNAKVMQADIDRANDTARMEWLDGWLCDQLNELKQEALSASTVATYDADTRAFIKYVNDLGDNETPYPARDPQVAMYFIHKLMEGAADGTLWRIASALRWANSLKGAADPVGIYSRAVLKLAQAGGIEALHKTDAELPDETRVTGE